MSVIICPLCEDSQSDIKQIIMHFVRSVSKKNQNGGFKELAWPFLIVNVNSETERLLSTVCSFFFLLWSHMMNIVQFQSRRIGRNTRAYLCPLFDNIVTKLLCLDCANKSQRHAMCPQSFAYIRIHLHCIQSSALYYTNGSQPPISSHYNSGSPFALLTIIQHAWHLIMDAGARAECSLQSVY